MRNTINRFLFSVVDAFHPELTKKKEKCIFTSRDFNITLARWMETPGSYIREYKYAGGEVNFHLIQTN